MGMAKEIKKRVVDKTGLTCSIGIANSMWKWGNLDSLLNVLKTDLEIKTKYDLDDIESDEEDRFFNNILDSDSAEAIYKPLRLRLIIHILSSLNNIYNSCCNT